MAQYQHLTKATVNLKLNNNGSAQASPAVGSITFETNATYLFLAGLKFKIPSFDNIYQAKQQMPCKLRKEYASSQLLRSFYKAQKTVELLKENQKKHKTTCC
jgi:hypothetical protein